MTIYKIRNSHNKFSNGGYSCSFSKYGKVWNGLGSFKNHLKLLKKYYSSDPFRYYHFCYVLEINLIERNIKEIPFFDFILKEGLYN